MGSLIGLAGTSPQPLCTVRGRSCIALFQQTSRRFAKLCRIHRSTCGANVRPIPRRCSNRYNMTVLVSHLTGNPNARAVLRGLERHGLSPVFFTTLAISRGMVEKLSVSPRLAIELGRRVFAELPPSRIMTMPWRELVRQIARRVGLTGLARHETGWASCDAIYTALDRHVARALREE